MIKTKIIVSKDRNEHEFNLDECFKKIKDTKPIIIHKLVKAKGEGLSFLTFVHYKIED